MDGVDKYFVEQEIAKLSQQLLLSRFLFNGNISEIKSENLEMFCEPPHEFEFLNYADNNPSAIEGCKIQKDFVGPEFVDCLENRGAFKGDFFPLYFMRFGLVPKIRLNNHCYTNSLFKWF